MIARPPPRAIPSSTLIVMNMISSDQNLAWSSLLPFLPKHLNINLITTGVLQSQLVDYLSWARRQNWSLVSQAAEDQWSALIFKILF